MMATMTAMATATASAPSLHDASHQERTSFENALRLWALGVRFATRDLVALGRPLELRLALAAPTPPLVDVAPLGFELSPLYGSHIMRVTTVVPSRVDSRVVSLQGAPTPPDVSPLDHIRVDDFLVGIDGDDLLLAPSTGLAQVRKRILGACNAALARGSGVVTLRFVRLDATVQVDPTRHVTHGSVLRALETLEKNHTDLKASYDQLLNRNRAAVTHRLTRHKMLLGFGVHMAQTLRAAVQQDERYKFAAKFQHWYAAMMAETEYQDQGNDDGVVEVIDLDSDAPMEPTVYEIDDYDFGGDDDADDADVASVPPVSVDPSLPPAQPRPADIDLQWRNILRPQEMKWLPLASVVLTKFIESLVDGFASDGLWVAEMATCSRAIVERLVTTYTHKLTSARMDNATVRREFMKHARMIRSNITNPGNKPLRRDVLSGAIPISTLCEMTSEQLAPKALQEDRQRRYEQHAKEITITAPTEPLLLKTKHGFKEVNIGGVLAAMGSPSATPGDEGAVAQPREESDTKTTSTTSTSGTLGASATASDSVAPLAPVKPVNPADEVTQRLSVLGVNSLATDEKKVRDNGQIATHGRPNVASSKQPLETPQVTPKPSVKVPTLETVTFTAEDFRKFLMVMFDPAQDIEGTIGQLQSTVHSTPLSTMSNEFVLAPGVQLYRDVLTAQTQHGGVHFRARVRLLNWMFQRDSTSDREATMDALRQLLMELRERRRLFGRLLDQLGHECGFPQSGSNQRAHRLAVDVLVRAGMVVTDQHTRDGYRADARIDGIEVATAYAASEIEARDRAARSAAAFMSEVVAIRKSIVHPPQPPPNESSDFQDRSFEPPRFEHARYREGERHTDHGVQFESDRYGRDPNRYGLERKRPFDHVSNQTDIGQPAPVRRKVDAPRVSPETSSLEDDSDRPVFFEDSRGEERRQIVDPAEKERKEKQQVETYQELLRLLFRNREDVKSRARFDWNPDIPEKEIEFTSRLKVTRTVSRVSGSGNYVCSLQGLDGNLFITNSNTSLEAAADYVTKMLHGWLDSIYDDWTKLVGTYNRIVERKVLQRGQQADARLSAGNETRKDRAVNSFTKEQEKSRGPMAEYTIMIRTLPAVRQLCMNAKMAKRAAGEEFRDLVEWINKTRQDKVKGQLSATNDSINRATPSASSAQTSRAVGNPSPASARAPPKPRPKSSNMVVCSDDSGDDDGDDDYHGGGVYSDDDDWHPQPKSTLPTSGVSAPVESGSSSLPFRVDEILKQPYPIESERNNSDDARFRAVIRSLFTPEDDLCTGISRIRGALKYRGHYDTVIVPNVKASIRLELLRGETFNVYASVNDVIHCKATASSKPDACDKAVNGLLKELDETRQIWTELVHFYHTKELSNNDPMDTFNALRLANITKIETMIETRPTAHQHTRMLEAKMATDVHCVIYFGRNAVYRVNEVMENEAHTMATCHALRFIVDLIDKGLDPRPLDEQDQRFAPLPDANLRCHVDLEDFGDRKKRVEFHADARWAIPGRVPGRDFGLPERLTLNQIDRLPMQTFERNFVSSSGIYYFRLDATYDNGKFVNHVAEYGHKNKYRAYVLHLEVKENRDMDVYLFPPGASVNSTGNLYWSHKVMPSEIDDIKSVYGYVVRRR